MIFLRFEKCFHNYSVQMRQLLTTTEYICATSTEYNWPIGGRIIGHMSDVDHWESSQSIGAYFDELILAKHVKSQYKTLWR